MKNLSRMLINFDACGEAVRWAEKYAEYSPCVAWRACPRGDWLLWIAHVLDVDGKLIARAGCACARLVLQYVPDKEMRPMRAVEAAEALTWNKATWNKWNKTTLKSVQTAADAAYAAYAAYAASHAYAASSASSAASYAAHAASFASFASHAAYAASSAASYAASSSSAASYAARKQMELRCAKVVRRVIPWIVIREAMANANLS